MNRINQTLSVLLALLVLSLVALAFEWGGWAGEVVLTGALLLAGSRTIVAVCRRVQASD
jgi:hypothetical protein